MKYISIFIFSLLFISVFGQKDSLKKKEKKENHNLHLGVGVDLVSPASALFSERVGASVLVDFQYFKNWFAQAQFGNEKNEYDDIGWKVKTNGSFMKLGANYIITRHEVHPLNQFYVGGKIAISGFSQDLNQVPIRALGQPTQYVDLGEDKAQAYWLEIPVGARVSILKEKLFIESIMSTNILLHAESELGINPVVIPNFGKNNGGLNFNLFWGITYFIF